VRSRHRLAVAAAVAAAAAVQVAAPAGAASPPLLAKSTLSSSDFALGGTSGFRQLTVDGGRPLYIHAFGPCAFATGKPLRAVISEAALEPDAATATVRFEQLQFTANTALGEITLAERTLANVTRGMTLTGIAVGDAQQDGWASFRLPVTVQTPTRTLQFLLEFAHGGRISATLVLLAWDSRPIDAVTSSAALGALARHLGVSVPPTRHGRPPA
jgi:hypothetical protein